MSNASRQQRKPSAAERRVERLRQARVSAPLLRELQASAASVSVQLVFADDTRLAPTARAFTVYPPARAHFVYACAFGDCDGVHDLDGVVKALLSEGASAASGSRCCEGHRANGIDQRPACGLAMTYTIAVHYDASQPERVGQPVDTA